MKFLSRAALFLSLAGCAAASFAQGPRAEKWEFTLQPQYTDSSSISGTGGSNAEIDSAFGFGLGLAYNLSNHFSIGGEFTWSEADYQINATPAAGNPGTTRSLSGELDSSTFRMNATWNILPGNFTPFLTGGVGATWVDTNIPDGPPDTFCWYDPWWGYYCGSSQSTHNDTYFSYMAGAGLRLDFPQSFFLRGMVARQWLDVGGDVGTPEFTQYRIDIGWRY